MFDATTLAAVVDELNEKILRGRVQEIVQTDAHSFGFEIYAQHKRFYLYMSAHPEDARVHLVSYKLRGSGGEPSGFLMLLRKYAEGALLDAIAPLPNERVLKIQFDHSEQGISTLVVETIGRYSNIILVDAGGDVMDAVKRVPAAINRTRVILPKHLYLPPPQQSKVNPTALDASQLARFRPENTTLPLWRVLVDAIAGVSPLLGREIQFRAGANTNAEKILATLTQLLHAPWQPCIALEEDEPAAFAPYALTHFPNRRAFDSISAAIEAFYGDQDAYAATRETLRTNILLSRDKLARKRDSLARSLVREEEIERLKMSGEMILAYASQIKSGETTLRAEIESGTMEIPLNPQLSAVENAQKYFKEYHRVKDARARVPTLLDAANAELDYAEQMLNDLDLAETRDEIDAVAQAAREAGLIRAPRVRKKIAASEPLKFESRDGFTIFVGKNARQNEEVTFKRAKPDDLWLHARKVAGAHVVIQSSGRNIPGSTVEEAAKLAAQHSQARNESKVDVIVTERRNVRRVRGGRPGMVTVKTETNIQVNM